MRKLLDVETPYFAAPAPLDQRGRAITPVRVVGQCIYISQCIGYFHLDGPPSLAPQAGQG